MICPNDVYNYIYLMVFPTGCFDLFYQIYSRMTLSPTPVTFIFHLIHLFFQVNIAMWAFF